MELLPVKLPSGAILRINHAPFPDAWALYQQLLAEFKPIKADLEDDMAGFIKTAFCTAMTSRGFTSALDVCMKRVNVDYGNGPEKIHPELFEPIENRADYQKILLEVAKANLLPFTKDLLSDFKAMAGRLMSAVTQKSESPTTSSSPMSDSAKVDTLAP